MSAGLVALLDDIAALARMAAASVDDIGAAAGRASAKASVVVVDDTAVTPRYVTGFSPQRELPMIKRIAIGSLRNKLVFILPAILLMSQFLPWLLTPLLMLGGTYLCFEGAEKILHSVRGHETTGQQSAQEAADGERSQEREDQMVAGAIRTDFILNEVAAEAFWTRAIILVVVAIAITILVYGVVALIVKMDDIGLHLAETKSGAIASLGRGLVAGMPKLLKVLTVVGVVAMLWVGGHILLVGTDSLGWHALYGFVHHLEEAAAHATGAAGGFVGWLVNTFFSAIIGLVVGFVVVGIMHVLPLPKKAAAH